MRGDEGTDKGLEAQAVSTLSSNSSREDAAAGMNKTGETVEVADSSLVGIVSVLHLGTLQQIQGFKVIHTQLRYVLARLYEHRSFPSLAPSSGTMANSRRQDSSSSRGHAPPDRDPARTPLLCVQPSEFGRLAFDSNFAAPVASLHIAGRRISARARTAHSCTQGVRSRRAAR
jgi:hypothetical protein